MKIIAVIINILFPGVGSMILGRIGVGIAQLIIYLVGAVLAFTVILSVVGIPMMVVAWIWGLVTAATSPSEPITVNVVQKSSSDTQKSSSDTTD